MRAPTTHASLRPRRNSSPVYAPSRCRPASRDFADAHRGSYEAFFSHHADQQAAEDG